MSIRNSLFQPKPRSGKKAALAVFILTTAYFLFLVTSPHGLRASITKVVEVDADFFKLPPSMLQGALRFEDENLLKEFTSPVSHTGQADRGDIEPIEILHRLSKMNLGATRLPFLPESPSRLLDLLESQRLRGSCYNDAILYSTFAQASGWKARHVSPNSSDGLGRWSHNVVEVWVEQYGKWILIDPQQSAFFTDRNTVIPLSVLEIRQKVLTLSKEAFYRAVDVTQDVAFVVPEGEIWEFYQAMNELHIYGSGDYYTRIRRGFANKVADWLEALAGTHGQWALPGRFFRAFFGELPRFRLVDEYTPKLHYAAWYYSFRVVLVMWVGSLCILVFIRARRERPLKSGTLSVPGAKP
jgi:hypothetical protein